jgi:hypothetical protein
MKSRKKIFVLAVLATLAFAGLAHSDEGFATNAEVLETMNAGGYTYVRVKTDSGVVWAAGPQAQVKVGDRVNLAGGMLMSDFHSETLDRDFEEIYFVGGIEVVGGGSSAPAMASAHGSGDVPAAVEIGTVKKAEGGATIAELYAGKSDLAGKQVIVRGRVVKYTANIMGRNWLHIQDGSSQGGTGDLTVTTDGTAKIGDLVLVKGTAAVDKDFGAGYSYELIVEEATVTVE